VDVLHQSADTLNKVVLQSLFFAYNTLKFLLSVHLIAFQKGRMISWFQNLA
jgi:hypothetical protein